MCDISPSGVSWQVEIIFLPKPTSNTFWHKFKMLVLAISTHLHELSFFPQPHLVLLYLLHLSLPEKP